MDLIDILLSASFWAAAIRIASPLIFATIGELICERAGVLNLGIEGIMVAGAFAGWIAVWGGLPLWGGVAVAMLTGMMLGLVHSVFSVPFGLSQHVVGVGLTLLATSLTFYTYRVILPEVSSPPKITAFQPYEIPLLSDLPLVGPALFSQTPLTYAAFTAAGNDDIYNWQFSAPRTFSAAHGPDKSKCATWPKAWTPESVRPAERTGTVSPENSAMASSSACWTEKPLVWRCQPTKPPPSYSKVILKRGMALASKGRRRGKESDPPIAAEFGAL